MRLVNSGDIQRLFAKEDPQTILRRPNIRQYAKDNGVEHYIMPRIWLINLKEFMQAIAPKEYPRNKTMPRLRCIKTSVNEYNSTHEKKIDKHVIEKCIQSNKVFKYHYGRKWVINYDELEPVIDKYLVKKEKEKEEKEQEKQNALKKQV